MRTVPSSHPGEVPRTEFLEPLEITAYRLARDIAAPQTRISEILSGRRGIPVDTAPRLSRYFGQPDAFWINLQRDYEVAFARPARRRDREDQALVEPGGVRLSRRGGAARPARSTTADAPAAD